MFWTFLAIYGLLFLAVLIAFAIRIHDGKGVVVCTAAAGDPHIVVPHALHVVNLNKKGFYDKDGGIIDYEMFQKYSAAGWSMLLAGIKDGDLLFVKPYDNSSSMNFPCVVVIEREHFPLNDLNTAHYKVRRSWAICRLDRNDIGEVLEQIINSDAFKELYEKNKDKNCFLKEEDMKSDFFNNRLAKYVQDYPTCKNVKDSNNIAVISTTLDTKQNIVHFSIHPYRCVKGEVKYSFGLQENAA